jgi:hypothetical protein
VATSGGRKIQDYVLTATEIRRSTLGPELSFAAGTCCEGIEIVPTSDGVAFRIDVPGTLEIVCGSLIIEAEAERREQVPPDQRPGVQRDDTRNRSFSRAMGDLFRTAGGFAGACTAERRASSRGSAAVRGWYLQEPAAIPRTTAASSSSGAANGRRARSAMAAQ